MADADVIIVGAGPTGLTLAVELCLGGVTPVVLERRPQVAEVAKAGGLNGHILEVLRARGALPRFEAASSAPRRSGAFPWGGIHVDLASLPAPPMEAAVLPQPELERLLEAQAVELGAEVRRWHEVVGLEQAARSARVSANGPEGAVELRARYVVGCDGGHSRVRELAGIGFPGTTYAETERMGVVTRPPSLTVDADGGLVVPGAPTIPFGYTATEHGVFAFSEHGPDLLGFYTSEAQPTEDDDEAMTIDELHDSIHRVLGIELPMGEPLRLTRFGYQARQADRYRDGRVLLAGDAAHLFPAGGVAINAGMLDAVNLGWKLAAAVRGWAPDDLLDSYEGERRAAAERTVLHTRAQVALRRGHDPEADALRAVLQELLLDEPARQRLGTLMAGDDLPCPTPGPGDHPLVGRFVLDLALDVDGSTDRELDRGPAPVAGLPDRSEGSVGPLDGSNEGAALEEGPDEAAGPGAEPGGVHPDARAEGRTGPGRAGLLAEARAVLVVAPHRPELGRVAEPWSDRVDVRELPIGPADAPAADALLVRPDGQVAWAAGPGPTGAAGATLTTGMEAALERWFGAPTVAGDRTG